LIVQAVSKVVEGERMNIPSTAPAVLASLMKQLVNIGSVLTLADVGPTIRCLDLILRRSLRFLILQRKWEMNLLFTRILNSKCMKNYNQFSICTGKKLITLLWERNESFRL